MNTITEEQLILAQINTPENIRYYINRIKNILNKGQQNNWEDDCYKLIINYNEKAYSIIYYASLIILRVKSFKNTEELTSCFDSIMYNLPIDFEFDELKLLISKYAQEYIQVLNVFLFDLTEVNSKVKRYLKNKDC